jgi:hypothetical protein
VRLKRDLVDHFDHLADALRTHGRKRGAICSAQPAYLRKSSASC